MSTIKPNHICKNIFCTKGENGSRKKYYACDYCDRVENWKSVACSMDCWIEFQRQVLEARSNHSDISVLPERLDKTVEEENDLMKQDISTVLENTKKELQKYTDKDICDNNIPEIIEQINDSIEENFKQKRSKNKVL